MEEQCLFNGLENPEIRKYLKKHKMVNCLNCEYEYPCPHYEKTSKEKEKWLEKIIQEEAILTFRAKEESYQTANL